MPKKLHVSIKKKSWLSLATENNAKKNIFYSCFVAHEKPYLCFFCSLKSDNK
jgi:hypothetical protein